MEWSKVKRFYRSAAAEPAGEGFTVALDGRPLRTPAGNSYELPSVRLAEAIAGEWEAQEDQVRPETMPLTQLAATAIDRIPAARDRVVAEMLRYGGTDLLCYRAESPLDLVVREEETWTPLLDWAAETYGARLSVTTGILPLAQPGEAIDALRDVVEDITDLELAALSEVASVTGSLVIALAVVEGELDAEGAFDISQLEETWQIEQWGEDEDATERRARIRADLEAADLFLELLAEG